MGGGAPCVSDFPSHLFGKSVPFQQIIRKATERTFRTHIRSFFPVGLLFAFVRATLEFPNNPDALFQLLRPLVLGLAIG